MWIMTNLEQTFLESATRYFRESQSKEIDWEQRRYEIAKDVLIEDFFSRELRKGGSRGCRCID